MGQKLISASRDHVVTNLVKFTIVVDNRTTQDTFQNVKEIKICHFYIPFFEAIFILLRQ